MGQRHQIFIKIPNPAKNISCDRKQKKELKARYGNETHTILVYHNQWLFGRGAVSSCKQLLEFTSQFTKKEKLGKYGTTDVPFSKYGQMSRFSTAERIEDAIGFIINFRAKSTDWLGAGIDSSWCLNKTEPELREDFTQGDNNDGITIIDTIENKYCFMNIYPQNKRGYRVARLPMLQPVNASQYVSAYYGETIGSTNPYYFGNHDRKLVTMSKEEQQTIVNNAIEVNKLACEGYEKFEVLTLEEIQVMFKKMALVKEPVTV